MVLFVRKYTAQLFARVHTSFAALRSVCNLHARLRLQSVVEGISCVQWGAGGRGGILLGLLCSDPRIVDDDDHIT
jgi:hypothetical protein